MSQLCDIHPSRTNSVFHRFLPSEFDNRDASPIKDIRWPVGLVDWRRRLVHQRDWPDIERSLRYLPQTREQPALLLIKVKPTWEQHLWNDCDVSTLFYVPYSCIGGLWLTQIQPHRLSSTCLVHALVACDWPRYNHIDSLLRALFMHWWLVIDPDTTTSTLFYVPCSCIGGLWLTQIQPHRLSSTCLVHALVACDWPRYNHIDSLLRALFMHWWLVIDPDTTTSTLFYVPCSCIGGLWLTQIQPHRLSSTCLVHALVACDWPRYNHIDSLLRALFMHWWLVIDPDTTTSTLFYVPCSCIGGLWLTQIQPHRLSSTCLVHALVACDWPRYNHIDSLLRALFMHWWLVIDPDTTTSTLFYVPCSCIGGLWLTQIQPHRLSSTCLVHALVACDWPRYNHIDSLLRALFMHWWLVIDPDTTTSTLFYVPCSCVGGLWLTQIQPHRLSSTCLVHALVACDWPRYNHIDSLLRALFMHWWLVIDPDTTTSTLFYVPCSCVGGLWLTQIQPHRLSSTCLVHALVACDWPRYNHIDSLLRALFMHWWLVIDPDTTTSTLFYVPCSCIGGLWLTQIQPHRLSSTCLVHALVACDWPRYNQILPPVSGSSHKPPIRDQRLVIDPDTTRSFHQYLVQVTNHQYVIKGLWLNQIQPDPFTSIWFKSQTTNTWSKACDWPRYNQILPPVSGSSHKPPIRDQRLVIDPDTTRSFHQYLVQVTNHQYVIKGLWLNQIQPDPFTSIWFKSQTTNSWSKACDWTRYNQILSPVSGSSHKPPIRDQRLVIDPDTTRSFHQYLVQVTNHQYVIKGLWLNQIQPDPFISIWFKSQTTNTWSKACDWPRYNQILPPVSGSSHKPPIRDQRLVIDPDTTRSFHQYLVRVTNHQYMIKGLWLNQIQPDPFTSIWFKSQTTNTWSKARDWTRYNQILSPVSGSSHKPPIRDQRLVIDPVQPDPSTSIWFMSQTTNTWSKARDWPSTTRSFHQYLVQVTNHQYVIKGSWLTQIQPDPSTSIWFKSQTTNTWSKACDWPRYNQILSPVSGSSHKPPIRDQRLVIDPDTTRSFHQYLVQVTNHQYVIKGLWLTQIQPHRLSSTCLVHALVACDWPRYNHIDSLLRALFMHWWLVIDPDTTTSTLFYVPCSCIGGLWLTQIQPHRLSSTCLVHALVACDWPRYNHIDSLLRALFMHWWLVIDPDTTTSTLFYVPCSCIGGLWLTQIQPHRLSSTCLVHALVACDWPRYNHIDSLLRALFMHWWLVIDPDTTTSTLFYVPCSCIGGLWLTQIQPDPSTSIWFKSQTTNTWSKACDWPRYNQIRSPVSGSSHKPPIRDQRLVIKPDTTRSFHQYLVQVTNHQYVIKGLWLTQIQPDPSTSIWFKSQTTNTWSKACDWPRYNQILSPVSGSSHKPPIRDQRLVIEPDTTRSFHQYLVQVTNHQFVIKGLWLNQIQPDPFTSIWFKSQTTNTWSKACDWPRYNQILSPVSGSSHKPPIRDQRLVIEPDTTRSFHQYLVQVTNHQYVIKGLWLTQIQPDPSTSIWFKSQTTNTWSKACDWPRYNQILSPVSGSSHKPPIHDQRLVIEPDTTRSFHQYLVQVTNHQYVIKGLWLNQIQPDPFTSIWFKSQTTNTWSKARDWPSTTRSFHQYLVHVTNHQYVIKGSWLTQYNQILPPVSGSSHKPPIRDQRLVIDPDTTRSFHQYLVQITNHQYVIKGLWLTQIQPDPFTSIWFKSQTTNTWSKACDWPRYNQILSPVSGSSHKPPIRDQRLVIDPDTTTSTLFYVPCSCIGGLWLTQIQPHRLSSTCLVHALVACDWPRYNHIDSLLRALFMHWWLVIDPDTTTSTLFYVPCSCIGGLWLTQIQPHRLSSTCLVHALVACDWPRYNHIDSLLRALFMHWWLVIDPDTTTSTLFYVPCSCIGGLWLTQIQPHRLSSTCLVHALVACDWPRYNHIDSLLRALFMHWWLVIDPDTTTSTLFYVPCSCIGGLWLTQIQPHRLSSTCLVHALVACDWPRYNHIDSLLRALFMHWWLVIDPDTTTSTLFYVPCSCIGGLWLTQIQPHRLSSTCLVHALVACDWPRYNHIDSLLRALFMHWWLVIDPDTTTSTLFYVPCSCIGGLWLTQIQPHRLSSTCLVHALVACDWPRYNHIDSLLRALFMHWWLVIDPDTTTSTLFYVPCSCIGGLWLTHIQPHRLSSTCLVHALVACDWPRYNHIDSLLRALFMHWWLVIDPDTTTSTLFFVPCSCIGGSWLTQIQPDPSTSIWFKSQTTNTWSKACDWPRYNQILSPVSGSSHKPPIRDQRLVIEPDTTRSFHQYLVQVTNHQYVIKGLWLTQIQPDPSTSIWFKSQTTNTWSKACDWTRYNQILSPVSGSSHKPPIRDQRLVIEPDTTRSFHQYLVQVTNHQYVIKGLWLTQIQPDPFTSIWFKSQTTNTWSKACDWTRYNQILSSVSGSSHKPPIRDQRLVIDPDTTRSFHQYLVQVTNHQYVIKGLWLNQIQPDPFTSIWFKSQTTNTWSKACDWTRYNQILSPVSGSSHKPPIRDQRLVIDPVQPDPSTSIWFKSQTTNTWSKAREGRKEGTCLFDINNHNTEYTTVKLCRETPTKAQSVPLSREPPTCHNT